LPRGKQSGIRYGQKKQDGQSDLEQLIDIQNYLIRKFNVKTKREWFLIFNKETENLEKIVGFVNKDDLGVTVKNADGYNEYTLTSFARNPDLMWIDKYGLWVIEVDGAVHDRYVLKTEARNELYIRNHIKLIVVNLAEMKELKLDIYAYIDQRIEELV